MLSPHAAAKLMHVLKHGGRGLAMFNAGCSDVEAEVPLYVPQGNDERQTPFATLTDSNMPFVPGSGEGANRKRAVPKRVSAVATLRLDAVLRPNGSGAEVGLLKLDAQGHELRVLQGAQRLLCEAGAPEFVQLEFVPRMISHAAAEAFRTRTAITDASADQLPDAAPAQVLEMLRRSGRLCFGVPTSQLMRQQVHAPPGVVSTERYVAMHRYSGERAETEACGSLGCHSELFCIPLCRDAGPSELEAAVRRLISALGLGTKATGLPQVRQLAREVLRLLHATPSAIDGSAIDGNAIADGQTPGADGRTPPGGSHTQWAHELAPSADVLLACTCACVCLMGLLRWLLPALSCAALCDAGQRLWRVVGVPLQREYASSTATVEEQQGVRMTRGGKKWAAGGPREGAAQQIYSV